MASIYLLIPIAVIFVIIAVALLFWAIKHNQYDDLDREGYNILFDDPEQKTKQPKELPKSTTKTKK